MFSLVINFALVLKTIKRTGSNRQKECKLVMILLQINEGNEREEKYKILHTDCDDFNVKRKHFMEQ